MTPWLWVVGIGEDGLDGLGASARAAVEQAEVVIGGRRHLAMLADDRQERIAWPSPFDTLADTIGKRRGRPVCVPRNRQSHASRGRRTPRAPLRDRRATIIPAPSAFSLACARLGWDRTEAVSISVHGQPLARVNRHLHPGARLLVLSHDGKSAAALGRLLVERGFGASRLHVMERLGGPHERSVMFEARSAAPGAPAFADLNIIGIECVADPDTRPSPGCPGLPDECYEHDGQITKRVVRAATVAALAPLPGQRLWDVGAGCGSVSIEWLRAAGRTCAVAVEADAGRAELIARNARKLGVPELEIVTGTAPEALAGLSPPDAVFVGGGVTVEAVVARCWEALAPGGRLVCNAVSVEGERALADWHARLDGELTRIGVSHAHALGSMRTFRPALPVTQLAACKG